MEIFGLVVVVIFFEDEVEVIVIVNDSEFGLVGVVWMCDVVCVYWVVVGVNVGIFWVNSYKIINVVLFFGGFNCSGYGCFSGMEVFYDYM